MFLSLSKILELERKRGYRDDAVIGGLRRFFENWRKGLSDRSADKNDDLARELYDEFRGYSWMDRAQREKLVAESLEKISSLGLARPARRRRTTGRSPRYVRTPERRPPSSARAAKQRPTTATPRKQQKQPAPAPEAVPVSTSENNCGQGHIAQCPYGDRPAHPKDRVP